MDWEEGGPPPGPFLSGSRHDVQPQQRPVHILVVDDVQVVRLSLRRILEREGYRCLEAADGNQALVLATHENPELMLCDINMPGVGGMDLVRLLQGRIPDMSIIMVSAEEDAETDPQLVCHGGS